VIVFFVWREYGNLLSTFFETWGSRLADRVRFVWYDDLAQLAELPGAACYAFADLERLSPDDRRCMSELADMLAETEAAPRIVNHPREVLLRYELLRTLHERGVNPFQVYRVPPVPADVRFPVFLRDEHEHAILTPLLGTRRDVERHLVGAYVTGRDLASLVLVEFEDVSDEEGLYNRYIAYVVGDTIVPGHLAFGSSWIVKGGAFLEGERLEQQLASVVPGEREEALLEITQLAGIGYGRFDYAVADGQLRVWELNTNPTLLLPPEEHRPFALEQVQPIGERLVEAFEQLAGETEAAGELAPVALPSALRGRPLVRPQLRRKGLVRSLVASKPVRLVLRPVAPVLTRTWVAARAVRRR
jgi:hypothetical protein